MREDLRDCATGAAADRAALQTALDYAREGDVLIVWKLDRLGWSLPRLSRSLKDVLHIMERIGSAGAAFRSITENIDTTTPAGRCRWSGPSLNSNGR
jgi:DNA invertase Pin-like site-specific DNA recombinase